MRSKVILLLTLLFTLFNVSVFAENAPDDAAKRNKTSITGRIIDESGLPLPGATVFIKSLNTGVISDVDGFYRINSLDAGAYEVSVSYIGFKDVSKNIETKIGTTVKVNFELEAGIDLNEVVVNGSLQGQSKAINQQKNSVNVTNIISADQVGRFPDQNVGDALKRIPGINVEYDQGEARFGHVRGTAPEYNSVTIDGDRIPSAEAEERSVQLDLIPSDMVQSIEVSKVVTPDMDGDAIGGAINLVTKSNPYKQRISGSFGTTYNALTGKPALNGAIMYGNRMFDDKLGFTVSASIQDHKLGSDDVEAEWDDDGTMKELQVRTYYVQRLRQSYSAALDFEINNNHKLEAKLMYNHRDDWENRYRVVYKDLDEDEAKIERQTKAGSSDNKGARLEDQRTIHAKFSGEHHFGALKADWSVSYSKASEERPNERYIQYKFKDVSISQDVSNSREPHITVNTENADDFNDSWKFDELTEEYQYTDDIDKKFKIDFKLPICNGRNESKLKFGVKYKGKHKERENTFYEYESTDEDAFNTEAFSDGSTINATKDNYLAGDYKAGNYISKDYVASLDLTDESQFEGEQNLEELAGNFEASENVIASYARYDQTIGKLNLIAGLRYEYTGLKYTGRELIMDEEGNIESLNVTDEASKSFNNILPSIILKYNLSKDSKLKFAWTNTIARPKYIGLVPRVEINNEDNEIEIGNPDLTPTTSMNFDLMFETYFQSIGVFSTGVFYKNINDFIVESTKEDYEYNGSTWDKFVQDINAGDATLLGFEVALQRQFDFLPGVLRQTGFYANYTFTHSEVSNFQIEGREDGNLSLPGTPVHNLNASLFYEGNKISARASFNYASDFIDEVAEDEFEDIYYDKVTYLDVNASYKLKKNFIVYAEVNNLLNQPLRYYQGSSEYTYQAEYYNVRFNAGIKFNF